MAGKPFFIALLALAVCCGLPDGAQSAINRGLVNRRVLVDITGLPVQEIILDLTGNDGSARRMRVPNNAKACQKSRDNVVCVADLSLLQPQTTYTVAIYFLDDRGAVYGPFGQGTIGPTPMVAVDEDPELASDSPMLALDAIRYPSLTNRQEVEVCGRLRSIHPHVLTVGDSMVPVNGSGDWCTGVRLLEGRNSRLVHASDIEGNTLKKKIVLVKDTQPAEISFAPGELDIYYGVGPAFGTAVQPADKSARIAFDYSDATPVTITVESNGRAIYSESHARRGTFSMNLGPEHLAAGDNRVKVIVTDVLGHRAVVEKNFFLRR